MHHQTPPLNSTDPQLPTIKIHHPPSPRHHSSGGPAATPTPTAGARRRIGIVVDLSDESAYAVQWAVSHYICPVDAVILLHISPTSVLFGVDWGSIDIRPGVLGLCDVLTMEGLGVSGLGGFGIRW
ncbi:hypothetical protein G4B88_024115 [Cannabis sativa]|uniref:UspA domain-containing protein n=1 Tax=Cannabis sativa TaxID=3483 RepID=A0A7J6EGL5_CANSA|nr:hypothetical protein G4B88_024115 [Cannabis sativa]